MRIALFIRDFYFSSFFPPKPRPIYLVIRAWFSSPILFPEQWKYLLSSRRSNARIKTADYIASIREKTREGCVVCGATVIEIYPRKIAVILGAFTDMEIFRRGMFAVSMAGRRRGEGRWWKGWCGLRRQQRKIWHEYTCNTCVDVSCSKIFRIFYFPFRNLT